MYIVQFGQNKEYIHSITVKDSLLFYRLTFNVKLGDVMMWANQYKGDHIVAVAGGDGRTEVWERKER